MTECPGKPLSWTHIKDLDVYVQLIDQYAKYEFAMWHGFVLAVIDDQKAETNAIIEGKDVQGLGQLLKQIDP